jgi:hypothetical protein
MAIQSEINSEEFPESSPESGGRAAAQSPDEDDPARHCSRNIAITLTAPESGRSLEGSSATPKLLRARSPVLVLEARFWIVSVLPTTHQVVSCEGRLDPKTDGRPFVRGGVLEQA